VRPSPDAEIVARDYKIAHTVVPCPKVGYCSLPAGNSSSVVKWREALARGMPIVAGLRLTPEYEALTQGNPFYQPDKNQPLSKKGHVVVVVGFEDGSSSFFVKDSRGKGFANFGTWHLPYDVVSTPLVPLAYGVYKLTY
jgi:hypothetical protein